MTEKAKYINKEDVVKLLDDVTVVLFDVRRNWDVSIRKIKNAVRD